MGKVWVFFSILFLLFLSLFSCNLTFAKNVAIADKSTLTVNPSSIPADGITIATITITVKDIYGNLLVGDHITLTSTADSGLMINGSAAGTTSWTAATNSNGQAIFTVKSNNAISHTDTFTAKDVTDSPAVSLGSAINNSVTVAFTIPNSSPACPDTAPGGAPQLVSAVPDGSDKITLTWTAATNPVSYYSLSYGTTSGQYIYGNPNVGTQGTTTYTVGSLAKGTTYFFTLRAVNGCNSGSYSNELFSVAGESPTPTPAQKEDISEKDASDSASDLEIDNAKQSTNSSLIQNAPTTTPSSQLTNTPAPAPTAVASSNTNKIIIYSLLFVVVLSSAGVFYWWKFRRNKKKVELNPEIYMEVNSKTSSEINSEQK